MAALRFVYTVSLKRPWIVEEGIPTSRQPKKLPVVPSPEEVSRFLDAVKSPKRRMILTVCYATGLRISEAVSLTRVPTAIIRSAGASNRVITDRRLSLLRNSRILHEKNCR
jgi:integrase